MGHSRSKQVDFTESLPDNVMVTIFSFLSLYEKLIVPRVCKRWYMLMKERRPWHCVDFWDKGPSKKHNSEPWLFPAKEDAILAFLQTHLPSSLKEIHLRFVSADILRFLQDNCPNIQVFSFLPRNNNSIDELYSYHTLLCDQLVCSNFGDLLFIPQNVVECRMNFLATYTFEKLIHHHYRQSTTISLLDDLEDQSSDNILRRLSNCRRLKYLALHSFHLTRAGAKILTESAPELHELCLVDVKVLDDQEQDTFNTIVTNLKQLKIFKFSGYGNVDFVLQIIPAWHSLRELWLGRLGFTDETFITMTSRMPQLEILGLDSIISDSILSAISRDLRNLKEVSLVGGEYTDSGLNCLRHHTSLKTLYICDYHIEKGPSFSLQTVYGVLTSLPMIECVQISCQRLKKRHSGEILPEINKPNLQIKIDYF